MAEGLKMMALNGHGIAFLPESAVTSEVKTKKLASAGDAWHVEMEIRLYREKPSPARPGKRAALEVWDYLAGKRRGGAGKGKPALAKVMPKMHKVMKT